MEFQEIIASIIWGALFGNFSIQILLALIMFLICCHGLVNGSTPKTKTMGFIISCFLHFTVYSVLIYIGNYFIDDYLGIRRIMNKPIFIVFCVLGIAVSLIPIPKKISTYWNLVHDAFYASMFEAYHNNKNKGA